MRKLMMIVISLLGIQLLLFSPGVLEDNAYGAHQEEIYDFVVISVDKPAAYFNDNQIDFDPDATVMAPKLLDGRTMVPVEMFEKIMPLVLPNANRVEMPSPIQYGRVKYLPLREAMEGAGVLVQYSDGIIFLGPLSLTLTDELVARYSAYFAQVEDNRQMEKDISQILGKLEAASNFYYRVGVFDFATNTNISYKGDQSLYPASLIKAFYLFAFLEQLDQGNLQLDKTHTLSQNDKYALGTKVTGSGNLQYQKNGTKYSFERLLSLSITISDNVAANIVMDEIGLKTLNQIADKYGLKNTHINRKFYEVNSARSQNTTTANDLLKVLILLESQVLSENSYQLATDMMKKTVNKNRIGRYIQNKVQVANKTGTVSNVGGDMALIYFPNREPIGLTVVMEKKPSKAFNVGQMELETARIAREIVEYFEQRVQ